MSQWTRWSRLLRDLRGLTPEASGCPRQGTNSMEGKGMSQYNPPPGLSDWELTVIGQSLVSDLGQQIHNLARLGLRQYCIDHNIDPDEVLDRELASLRRRYDVVCRFTVEPLPWSMYESIARGLWGQERTNEPQHQPTD